MLSFVKEGKRFTVKLIPKREQRMFNGCSRGDFSYFCRHDLHERRDNALVELNRNCEHSLRPDR